MTKISIGAGKNAPQEFNVMIEITAQSAPVKYEIDKETGLLCVDRFMATPMFYPCDYGYIPDTLADDGDPIDVLVISPQPLINGCIIQCRTVGVLNMSDEGGKDVKLVAVPTEKLSQEFSHIQDIEDLAEAQKNKIQHFFEHYKDLESGKWVKIETWGSKKDALKLIENALQQFKQNA